jgi:dolichol-phosphate mannosyltransferase
MKTLLIIPTYNEAENIEALILKALENDLSVLVVDDNSQDGTGRIVSRLAAAGNNVALLKRPKKMGLGSAYIDGFRYAIEHGFENIIMMDADFSHPPEKIGELLGSRADIAVGSRYVRGGGIKGWPWFRLALSKFANIYAKNMLRLPLADATSGFNRLSTVMLKKMEFEKLSSEGYGFLIELKYRAFRKGFSFEEIPIIFSERQMGKSKLGRKIIWEAFWLIPKLKFLN